MMIGLGEVPFECAAQTCFSVSSLVINLDFTGLACWPEKRSMTESDRERGKTDTINNERDETVSRSCEVTEPKRKTAEKANKREGRKAQREMEENLK